MIAPLKLGFYNKYLRNHITLIFSQTIWKIYVFYKGLIKIFVREIQKVLVVLNDNYFKLLFTLFTPFVCLPLIGPQITLSDPGLSLVHPPQKKMF